MNRMTESGLEVNPHAGPPQPYEEKYYMGGGATNEIIFGVPRQSDQCGGTQVKSPGQSKVVWVLAVIATVLLATAIGAGLGAGLAAKHKSSSSSGTPITITKSDNEPTSLISGTPITTNNANNEFTTIIQSGSIISITLSPATPPSLSCPAANGSTYTATHRPQPTLLPQVQAHSTGVAFYFEILCYTTFSSLDFPKYIKDMQIIINVTSFSDCLDACARYNFQMDYVNFPAYACTGIGWGRGLGQQPTGNPWPVCRLKNNVTLGSPNHTASFPGDNSAVLLQKELG